MKKVDFLRYKERVNKLHKAALAHKEAHDAYISFEEDLFDGEFTDSDWVDLRTYISQNKEIYEQLSVVSQICDELNH